VERICQDDVGRCSFIDVLEEAALRRTHVAVSLYGGEAFIDRVRDVVTENHEDYAVFEAHERVAVTNIRAATRAPPQGNRTG
jgi:Rho-binding antiterminator